MVLNKYIPSIINAALFQITWFACVIGSTYNLIWPGVSMCLVLFAWQTSAIRRHSSDIQLIFTAISLGLIIDTLWAQLGLIEFTNQWPMPGIAPVWMLVLWAGFALTINHSLHWLKQHPLLPALAGLIGGPASYLAGEKIGALNFQADTLLVCSSIGIVWSFALTILVLISHSKNDKKNTLRHFKSDSNHTPAD